MAIARNTGNGNDFAATHIKIDILQFNRKRPVRLEAGSVQRKTHGTIPGRLGGTVSELVSQTMDHTGGVAADATSDADTQKMTLETLSQRMDGEYGVNVDNEMAQLVQLQNAYAANSRVISMVQDLMNKLLEL